MNSGITQWRIARFCHQVVLVWVLTLLAACGGSDDGSVADSAQPEPTAASADSYADGWGPPLGSVLPLLDAPDQSGQRQTLASLTGDQGMLLFLNRSADW